MKLNDLDAMTDPEVAAYRDAHRIVAVGDVLHVGRRKATVLKRTRQGGGGVTLVVEFAGGKVGSTYFTTEAEAVAQIV